MSKGDDLPIEVVREGVRLFEEGKLHEANSNNREAIACYQRMMDITFPDPPVLNKMAFCYLMLNEVGKGKECLKQSLEIDPNDEEALHNLSLLHIDHGELVEAEKLTRRGLALQSNHPGHWKNLGKILYQRGNYPEAIVGLATAIGLAPDNYETHHTLALAYIRQCDFENAHQEFLRAIELCDDDGELLTDYALVFFVQERHSDAEQYLRRAVDVDPLRTIPHYMLAHCLLEQARQKEDDNEEDKVRESMELLKKALDLNIDCGEAWYLLGMLMVMFRNWEDAERYLSAGIERGVIDPQAWALHSAALAELGREDEATSAFDEFKRRDMKMNGDGRNHL